MRKKIRAQVCNFLIAILPGTRWHKLKRHIFIFFGYNLMSDVKINGGTLIYGQGPLDFGSSTWIGIGARFYLGSDLGVIIGDNCDIGPEVSFICGTHDVGGSHRRAGSGYTRQIIINNGVWIGARCSILGGAIIGPGSIVGAGSLVLPGNYPENVVLAGVPAKVIKKL